MNLSKFLPVNNADMLHFRITQITENKTRYPHEDQVFPSR